jgi:hypothetical protein
MIPRSEWVGGTIFGQGTDVVGDDAGTDEPLERSSPDGTVLAQGQFDGYKGRGLPDETM